MLQVIHIYYIFNAYGIILMDIFISKIWKYIFLKIAIMGSFTVLFDKSIGSLDVC